MSLIVQIYIISYIDVNAQAAFYKEVVVFVNLRIQNIHKELVISKYISPQLISNMNTWRSNNEFSNERMSRCLIISLCRMLGLVLVSCRLDRLVALTIFATLMVVLGVPTG